MTRRTGEYERITSLPRRTLTREYADECSEYLSPLLRRTNSKATLLPWQAVCLIEAVENGGLWCALPVGLGKTLLSYLLARVLGARRVMIIVTRPALDKTRQDFASYAKDWGAPATPFDIRTWNSLSPESGANILDRVRPDLIIVDEAHKLANRKSAAARRVDRYIVEHQDSVKFVAMTGTPSRKSIMHYWHLLCWALRDGAPVPRHEGEALEWAAALDEGVFGGGANPGVLGATRKEARAWYMSRLVSTPGVVVVDEDSAGTTPITVRWRIAPEDAVMDRHYARFLGVEQCDPAGTPVTDPLSRWRLDAQLGAGLYMKFRVPPPEEWATARRVFARFVRDAIDASTYTRRPLDTEAQVIRHNKDAPEVADWLEIKPTFKPETVVEWFSFSAIDAAREWLAESSAPGIVWVGTPEFGKALAKLTGLSYYGSEGTDARGKFLNRADPRQSLIASWNANKEGFNLQPWKRALICQPPQSALYLEQIFGRNHRRGADGEVVFDMLISSGGGIDSFETALLEASTVKERESLTQKILRAKIVRAAPTITPSNEFRWASRTRKNRRT